MELFVIIARNVPTLGLGDLAETKQTNRDMRQIENKKMIDLIIV